MTLMKRISLIFRAKADKALDRAEALSGAPRRQALGRLAMQVQRYASRSTMARKVLAVAATLRTLLVLPSIYLVLERRRKTVKVPSAIDPQVPSVFPPSTGEAPAV